jgi:hypothetical protein
MPPTLLARATSSNKDGDVRLWRQVASHTPIDDIYSPFARAVRAGKPHSRRTSSSCARKTAS